MIYLIYNKDLLPKWEKAEKEIINYLTFKSSTLYMTQSYAEAETVLSDVQRIISELPEKTKADKFYKQMMQESTEEIISLPDFLKLYSEDPKELLKEISRKVKLISLPRN